MKCEKWRKKMPDDIARAEERCMERLKSKIQVLETSYDFDTARLEEKCERLQKQLDIAVKGIKAVLDDELFCEIADGGLIMYLYTALERIEELDK